VTNGKSKQIAFEQAGLGSVLKQNKLAVPANQRDYAWTDLQVTQLFQDLAKAKADGADYFLGAIVTIPSADGVLEVVDGQQRLATTAILLAAMRDYLRTRNEKILVESIDNEFLTSIDRKSRSRVPNLKLNIDDNDLFRHIIVGDPDLAVEARRRQSHELISSAYQMAQAQVRFIVSALDPKDHGDTLEGWVSYLEHGALVVLMRVPDTADAYKMFETLNARGLETSQADLIKNYLFGRAGERLPEVQTRWGYMRGALETEGDGDITITFLRHALIVLYGFLREAQVFDKVEEEVKSPQSAVGFSSNLEALANTYVAVSNPQHERWIGYPDQVRRAIEVSNLFNIRPARPLMLAIAEKFNQKETRAAFQYLISVGVRLIIASSTRTGSVEEALANAANQVYDGIINNTSQLKDRLSEVVPRDKQFQDAFKVARVSNQRLARYYLRSLEMHAKGEGEPYFVPQDDPVIITLEHVLPRKPEGHWPGFKAEEVSANVPRLGNMVLLRASSTQNLGNNPFFLKQAAYAASPYILTNMLAGIARWTPAAIDKRQERLAELAVKTWPK
jgi:hypothetical protein